VRSRTKCNQGIGCLGDNPETLLSAVAYVENNRVKLISNSQIAN